MKNPLFDQNEKIKAEADIILSEKNLLGLLQKYGTPHVHGSYKLDLMTWRDLDIHLVSETITKQEFFTLGQEICVALNPTVMNFKDWRLMGDANNPDGYYWGVILGNERKGDWKIDLAAVPLAEHLKTEAVSRDIENRLTEENRAIILEIKNACWTDPMYRKKYGSMHIYRSVLDSGVVDLAGLKKYLENKAEPAI